MTPDDLTRTLLTLEEAAEQLGVSKSTLRRWTRQGIIESIRINPRGDRRFTPEQLQNFVRPRITGRPRKQEPQWEA